MMPHVAFSRWDPLRDLIALHEQIGQLVGTDAPGWTPPVDLYETATAARGAAPRVWSAGAAASGARAADASARDSDTGRRRAVSPRPPTKPAARRTAPTKSVRKMEGIMDLGSPDL